MGNSVSLLDKDSRDFSNILNAFRRVTKNPSYNPFKFDYEQLEQSTFEELNAVYSQVSKLLKSNGLPTTRLICLKADGNQDGHALYLADEVITFIDFEAYLYHLDKSGFDKFSHLLHEMIHASHYSINRKLSPTALVDEEDPLFTGNFPVKIL